MPDSLRAQRDTVALVVPATSCVPNRRQHAKAVGRYAFFLDRSTISYPVIKRTIHAPAYYDQLTDNDFGDVAFEAYVAPQIFIHNGVSVEDVQEGTCGGWSKVWTFSPIFELRQFGGFSSPLRSPSFMPRLLSLQLLNIARFDHRIGNWRGGIRIWEMQFLLQHHSNGGPGCLFREDSVVDDECVADIPSDQRVVDTTGSFSTDFARVSGAWLRGRIDGTGTLVRGLTLGAAVELHSRWLVFLPGYISREQQSIYGPYRAEASAEYQQLALRKFKWVSKATGRYIFYERKPSPDASPVVLDLETSLVSDDPSTFWRGWGLQLRYYQGQDYYNLFFFRDIRRLFLGVVIDPMSQHLK